MDANFYQFRKQARDAKKAKQAQIRFGKEVTGRGKTQDLVLISGSKPEHQKQIKPKMARVVAFGERPLGHAAPRSHAISARSNPPKQKKNHSLKKTFPKVMTGQIERPPDGLFRTKAVKSNEPWKQHGETPLTMSRPPIRVQGQKLFPLSKKETTAAWKKLMNAGGARTKGITANTLEAEPKTTVAVVPTGTRTPATGTAPLRTPRTLPATPRNAATARRVVVSPASRAAGPATSAGSAAGASTTPTSPPSMGALDPALTRVQAQGQGDFAATKAALEARLKDKESTKAYKEETGFTNDEIKKLKAALKTGDESAVDAVLKAAEEKAKKKAGKAAKKTKSNQVAPTGASN